MLFELYVQFYYSLIIIQIYKICSCSWLKYNWVILISSVQKINWIALYLSAFLSDLHFDMHCFINNEFYICIKLHSITVRLLDLIYYCVIRLCEKNEWMIFFINTCSGLFLYLAVLQQKCVIRLCDKTRFFIVPTVIFILTMTVKNKL